MLQLQLFPSTPPHLNSFFSSVAQSPGCDEYLGSGKVMDKCGMCGGDNTTCRLVSGVFKHSLSKIGYHKIVEIPEGATKINVTEMVKSRNYLGEEKHLSHYYCTIVAQQKNCHPLSSCSRLFYWFLF